MAQCPVCQKELPDDFGLIECAGCGTPLIVQIDGSVQSMDADSSAPSSHEEILLSEFHAEAAEVVETDQIQEAIPFAIGEESQGAPPSEESMPAAIPQTAEDVDAYFSQDSSGPAPEPEPLPPPPPPPSPQVLADLSSLANDTEAAAQGGSLRYTIHITGIDTSDIRGEFRELISDRRFLWDVDGIIKSIKSGRVKLENVTAVKAMLIVQRLRGLPLQIQWEQHVVHQA